MRLCCRILINLFLLSMLVACGESHSEGSSKKQKNEVSTEAGRFERGIRKKGCEVLTAALVSSTFEVNADDLKQTKVLGCLYTWSSETERVEAHFSNIRAHKSNQAAVAWFEKTTKDISIDQAQAEMDRLVEQIENNKSFDTPEKKATAKKILTMVGAKAVEFEDVESVGDDARMDKDGTVHVLVDNLTFTAAAYQGPVAPPIDMEAVKTSDMLTVAKKQDAEWAVQSAPQRKKDGVKLAKAIVGVL